jgi:phospholipid/cholesterol/gamma-HCH transport system substrate-binding protein
MRKEIKVGLFVTLTIVLLLAGLSYLRNSSVLRPPTVYYGIFDNVDGLTGGGRVLYKGFQVGTVADLQFRPTDTKVLLRVHLNQDIGITKDAIMTVKALDLVGTKGIEIYNGTAKARASSGDTLRDSVALGMFGAVMQEIVPVKDQISTLVRNINDVVLVIKHTTQDSANRANRMIASMETTLGNTAKFSGELPGMLKRINGLVDSLKDVASAVKQYDPGIKKILTNTGKMTDTLAQNSEKIVALIEQTKQSVTGLKNLLDQLNKGEGSLGKLLKDDKLYANLNNASKSLDELLVDFKARPKRYVHFSVFGRKEKVEVSTDTRD